MHPDPNAASDLFGQCGVQAVTTRQIAQLVGISEPSIYAHFPSIQAIQDEVGARAFGHLARIAVLNRPDLSTQEVQTRSQCLWAALHGNVALLLVRPLFPWADQHVLLKEQSRLAFNMVFD